MVRVMDFGITLAANSGTALPRQLYEALRVAILAGRLRPRERVPSTRDLARLLGVSRATVTSSYDQLLSEGYLRSVTVSGMLVSGELPDRLRQGTSEYVPTERDGGQSPR
jgi:GntR family transcriptional regulator/MocR family aminotransferase